MYDDYESEVKEYITQITEQESRILNLQEIIKILKEEK